MRKLILVGLLALLVTPMAMAQEPATITDEAKARTTAEWSLLIKGKLNRSAVIALLGKPSHVGPGTLYFNDRVRDADTGHLMALHVFFARGEMLPATNVSYIENIDNTATSLTN